MTKEELQSKTITYLRFPLIVGVVLIHSQFNELVINGVDLMKNGNFPVYTFVSYLLSVILPEISVPLFYFISGFLFFYKVNSFTGLTYVQKLKKRIKTLLVPYLFWNLLVLIFYFLAQTFLAGLMSGKQKLIADYTPADWLWAFWDTRMINPPTDVHSGAYPICFQFWFIRDLMVVILFSPLVYLLLKKFREYALLGLGLLWFFNGWFDVVGFSNTAFFFFSAGAYFSVYRKNFVELMQPFLLWSGLFFAIGATLQWCFRGEPWVQSVYKADVLLGIVWVVSLSAYLLQKGVGSVNTFLADSSFFIYAYHVIVLALVIKFLFKLFQPHTDGMVLGIYLFSPAFVIGLGLCLYYLFRKWLPRTTAFITGGR